MTTLECSSMPARISPPDECAAPASASAEPATLAVVVAYEDAPAGHRAIQALRNLVREVRPPIMLRPMLWRFDLLDDLQCRDDANADADRAALFLISTSTSRKVPAAVERWVNACLTRKQGETTAMIALFGPLEAWTITICDEDSFRTACQTLRRQEASA